MASLVAATPHSLQAKLVLLGDMGAGKSSLVLRFVKDQFCEHQESTIGAAFLAHTVRFAAAGRAGASLAASPPFPPPPLYISKKNLLLYQVVADDATIKFEIWDTAGQERYHSLAPMYYRGAAAAIIV